MALAAMIVSIVLAYLWFLQEFELWFNHVFFWPFYLWHDSLGQWGTLAVAVLFYVLLGVGFSYLAEMGDE